MYAAKFILTERKVKLFVIVLNLHMHIFRGKCSRDKDLHKSNDDR